MSSQPAIWAAISALKKIFCRLSHEQAVALGGKLGRLVAMSAPHKKNAAVKRCAAALKISQKEAKSIVMSSYDHFGRSAAEFCRLKEDYPIDALVRVKGEENLKRAYETGKGVIFMSAHLGNWEYGAAVLAPRYSMSAIGAQQRDSRITALVAYVRTCAGVHTVGKDTGDLKAAIKCLKEGGCLAVLIDQDARERGMVSDFLGHPASTPIGPVKLAYKLGCAVIPARVVRLADGLHHELRLYPAMADPSGAPFGQNEQLSVDMCNDLISGWIRENPAQWMWLYPRWATTVGL